MKLFNFFTSIFITITTADVHMYDEVRDEENGMFTVDLNISFLWCYVYKRLRLQYTYEMV